MKYYVKLNSKIYPELDQIMSIEESLSHMIFLTEACAYNDARCNGKEYKDLRTEYIEYVFSKLNVQWDKYKPQRFNWAYNSDGILQSFTEKQVMCMKEQNPNLIIQSHKDAYPCNNCERMERMYCTFGDKLNDEGICANFRKLRSNK